MAPTADALVTALATSDTSSITSKEAEACGRRCSGGGSSGGGSGGGGGGGGGRDSSRPYDQGISGQYVKPTPIETPEPPQLTKIGKQTWDLEL